MLLLNSDPSCTPWRPGLTQPTSLPVIRTCSQSLPLAPLALSKHSTPCQPWLLLLALPRAVSPPFQGKTPLPSTRLHSTALHYLRRALLPLSRVKHFTATLDACPPHFLHPSSQVPLLAASPLPALEKG